MIVVEPLLPLIQRSYIEIIDGLDERRGEAIPVQNDHK
jgi:hypothetical protein